MHWTHLPVALTPSADGPDADGCYSGCAVDVEGVVTLVYTGVRGDAGLPCIATSQDDDLSCWQKYAGNPVVASPPSDVNTTIFRDHSVWNEQGTWYQVIGSGMKDIGGTAFLYRSDDFRNWAFVDSLVSPDRVSEGIGEAATGWECPDFFELDGQHVLIAAMWDVEPICVGFFVGSYADHRFVPEHEGIVDPGACFYAPQSFTDDKGRRIMFGWVREARSANEQIAAGWSGVMTLPRVLSVLADGSLGSAPAPETGRLRARHGRIPGDQVSPGRLLPLLDIPGDACELNVRFSPAVAGTVGIDVLSSNDGRERTSITYDVETHTLALDTRSSRRSDATNGGLYRLEHPGIDCGPIELHIFVDHSIVEVFLNDEKCITGRAYPLSPDSLGVSITGSATSSMIEYVDLWDMTAR